MKAFESLKVGQQLVAYYEEHNVHYKAEVVNVVTGNCLSHIDDVQLK